MQMHKNPNLISSFQHALHGVKQALAHERNMALHFTIAGLTILLSLLLQLTIIEFTLIFFCIGLVIVAEMLNTAIEKTVDLISMEKRPESKFIKDVSAAAVLIASLTASVIGALIFLPKILYYFL
jgi:diacylglycerol kinase